MKVVVTLIVCVIAAGSTSGKIRNGYQNDIQNKFTKLDSLQSILWYGENFSPLKKLDIKTQIKELIDLISYYEMTEKLIGQLRIVSPGIFLEMDTITDKKGRPTDIYIRMIPRNKSRIQLCAASFFTQSQTDKDISISEYGENSVSIDIWLMTYSLFLLCHELGHMKYVIPNLAVYCKFYEKNYRRQATDLSFVGHKRNDESGRSSNDFEKRFFQDRATYSRYWGKKPESSVAIMQKIRKRNRYLGQPGEAIPSGTLANSRY